MENLIIATTPLQAKIANYIQNLYAEEKFIKVYLTPVMNERQEYYSRDFDCVFHVSNEATYEKALRECVKEYDKIFYASFDNPLIFDIVARSKYSHLMSFDDGYADIYPKGMYSLPLCSEQVGEYGLTRDDLINNTEKHFTLYDSDFHVVARDKLVYLKDFFKLDIETIKNGKTAKVLLGQNFSEKDESISINFISTYAKALNVDFYVPHPKEQFKIDNVEYLVTPLIFEDALVELFKEYEFVEVYHFTSSVSLHLKNTQNVSVKGIAVQYYYERQNELRRLGCDFIHVTLGWQFKIGTIKITQCLHLKSIKDFRCYGKVTHIFKPVAQKPVTVWVDEKGNPIKPETPGIYPAGIVSGYELVGTNIDPKTGNVIHVFKVKGSEKPSVPSQPGTPDIPVRPEDQMNPGTYDPENAEGQPGNLVDTVKARLKHLANTGDETSNTAAGFGALIAGIALAVRGRQQK